MSTRGTSFLHQWISNNAPDIVGAVSVAELTHKMLEEAKAIVISRGEVEEDTGSVYETIHDAIVHRDSRVAD